MFFTVLKRIATEFGIDCNVHRYDIKQWMYGSPIYAKAVLATLIQDRIITYEMPQEMIELYIANFSIYWNGVMFNQDIKRREREYTQYLKLAAYCQELTTSKPQHKDLRTLIGTLF
jgi:hypothetical protein